MSDTANPMADVSLQLVNLQAEAAARSESGLDRDRMWATMIGLADDKQNGVSVFVFRDGVKAEMNFSSQDGDAARVERDLFRTVASVVVPRATALAFLRGALAHMEEQDKANG